MARFFKFFRRPLSADSVNIVENAVQIMASGKEFLEWF
jgi:hypothetical protein